MKGARCFESSSGILTCQRTLMAKEEINPEPIVTPYDLSNSTPIRTSKPCWFSIHGPVACRWRDPSGDGTRR